MAEKIIMGNMLGMPSPRPDWNETNPLKGSFIRNKPDLSKFAAKDEIPIENVGEIVSLSAFNEEKYKSKTAMYSGTFNSGKVPFILQVTIIGNALYHTLYSGVMGSPVRVRSWTNLADSWSEWKTPNNKYDGNGNEISTTYATKDEVLPKPITEVPAILVKNTSYNFDEQTELRLNFPASASDGDVIYITFISMDTPTNLIIDTSYTSDIDLIPEAYTGYEMYAKYNGYIWIIKYSDYTVSEV